MPRISELPTLAQATSGDLIPIVDDAGNITKKVTANKVVPDGSVVATQLASNAVTTAKIGDGQVTSSKIDFTTSGGIWWEEVARITASTDTTTLNLTGIPRRARYHVMITSNSGSTSAGFYTVTFNNDTGASAYFQRVIRTTTTVASVVANNGNNLVGADTTTNGQHLFLDIMIKQNISVAAEYKTAVINGGTNVDTRNGFGIWTANAYITSIQLTHNQTNGVGAGSTIIVLGHD